MINVMSLSKQMSMLSCTHHLEQFNKVAAVILALFTIYGILASLLLVS